MFDIQHVCRVEVQRWYSTRGRCAFDPTQRMMLDGRCIVHVHTFPYQYPSTYFELCHSYVPSDTKTRSKTTVLFLEMMEFSWFLKRIPIRKSLLEPEGRH